VGVVASRAGLAYVVQVDDPGPLSPVLCVFVTSSISILMQKTCVVACS
jgi:hypothetical protein